MLVFAPPVGSTGWEVRVDGRRVTLQPNASADYPLRAEIAMGPVAARVEMIRR